MEKREVWTWRIAFVAAGMGLAVGFGNVWRFPWLCAEYGGGSFLLAYLVAVVVVALPGLILEMGIGHRFESGAPRAFARISRKFEWAGWYPVIICVGTMVFYPQVITTSLYYLWSSFTMAWGSDPSGFLYGHVWQATSGPEEIGSIPVHMLVWYVIIFIISWFVMAYGVKRLGRALQIVMPVFLLLLIIMVIRGVTLSGAGEGLSLYLTPKWSSLGDFQMWVQAIGQALFSVGVGLGSGVIIGSYVRQKADISTNAATVAMGDTLVAFIAGFAVFSAVGFLALGTGQPVAEAAAEASGSGLIFVMYPTLLNMMPASQFFGVVFFLCLTLAGLSTLWVAPEAMIGPLREKFGMGRKKATAIVLGIMFVLGLWFLGGHGDWWIWIYTNWLLGYTVFAALFIECIIIGWVFGAAKIREYLNSISELKLGVWFDIGVKFIIPAFMAYSFISAMIKEVQSPLGGMPVWTLIAGGWAVMLVIPIIAYVLHKMKTKEEVA